jgi:hypothetical protein
MILVGRMQVCTLTEAFLKILVGFILQTVCYSPDEELEHDVTCWMIVAIFCQTFCDQNRTFRLLDLLDWHVSRSRLSLIIHRVTAKEKPSKQAILELKKKMV